MFTKFYQFDDYTILTRWPQVREVSKVREFKFGQESQGTVRENGIKMLKTQGNLMPINLLVV